MIEVVGLTKYYGERRAIADLNFTIEQGHIAGFLGLNGAGKSTALKVLAGFLLPTSGTVRVDGIDIVAEPEAVRSRIGFLPEEPPLYKEMQVSAFLRYLGRLRGMERSALESRLPTVLARTGLTDRKDDIIGSLSLGYHKRVGIAQAIIHDPTLVILDEPVSGLDPLQRVEMRKLVAALRGDHTVLISSHNLNEIEETTDKLLILRDGELVAEGTEDEIHARLGSGDRLEVDVRGDATAAIALLSGLPVVRNVRLVGGAASGGELALRLAGEDLKLEAEAVASALVSGGFGLQRLQPGRNELEELFLKITGKSEDGQ